MAYPRNSESVAHDQIRAFVERVERMNEELKAINDDKKEIFAEAKGNGFDVKALKIVIQKRRQDASERMELEAIVSLYEAALGMSTMGDDEDGEQSSAPAPAHAREIIEEFDAETGEILDTESTAARMDAPNQNADGHGAVNVIEAGTQAPPVDPPIQSDDPTEPASGVANDPAGRPVIAGGTSIRHHGDVA